MYVVFCVSGCSWKHSSLTETNKKIGLRTTVGTLRAQGAVNILLFLSTRCLLSLINDPSHNFYLQSSGARDPNVTLQHMCKGGPRKFS